ncbi:prepilin-type N-terminal cleavage/methylation domain-containing protein [Idiomarina sp. M1R2S28]|uniref:Prepilin-type N-terminal cleavage/methylation domain-containing protein n=1 Tax=Idiomarina rhizosphaerae TaxID=2961572 RepID=A0A9X2JVF6_9GAMM|nr:prepilin-type N-terminal cleavage/methylation domain-containing protein [Idiomarina rhizosphaerae]MCP1339931.1 prepilin-type N-terminal cleavage/methylation domain-containing protein [Idiomarina rhizosphaerae]
MNWHKNKGFSLVEVLAGAALVALWSVSSLKILQVGLSAIDRTHTKAKAVEVLMTYLSEAQQTWAKGNNPELSRKTGQLHLTAKLTSIDQFNATTKVTVSWGKDNELTQTFWLSR